MAEIGKARGSQKGVRRRVTDQIAVRMARRTDRVGYPDAPEDERTAGHEGMNVVADAHADPAPFPSGTPVSRDRLSQLEIIARRDLQVGRAPFHSRHRVAASLYELRLVAPTKTLRGGERQRRLENLLAEPLRGLSQREALPIRCSQQIPT